jgi:predicted nucleic acid binding AN1-type Zn finger protein
MDIFASNIKMGKFLNTLFFVWPIQFWQPIQTTGSIFSLHGCWPVRPGKKNDTPLQAAGPFAQKKKTTCTFAQEKKKRHSEGSIPMSQQTAGFLFRKSVS